MIISFSGIDGAGKSTQIAALQSWLRGAEISVSVFRMWDDVVVFPWLRESMSHRAFGGDRGVGSPEKPLERRDKNVRSPFLSFVRCWFYMADAISLSLKVWRQGKRGQGVIIFDRYLYDELANLPLENRLAKNFVRTLLRLVPKPDVAYVLDAKPEAARARKPEYPLDFVLRNRESYLNLARLENLTVIDAESMEQAQFKIRETLLSKMGDTKAKSLLYQCSHDH